MNDDDLLFPLDDLERWKRRQLPQDWLAKRQVLLIARIHAQAAEVNKPSPPKAPSLTPATPPVAPPKPGGSSAPI